MVCLSSNNSTISNFYFIDVTPSPILAGFDGLNDGMLRGVKMFRGVLVLGRVAAAHVAAGETHAQVHPGVSDLEAVFTAARAGFDVANFLQVFAFAHFFSPVKRFLESAISRSWDTAYLILATLPSVGNFWNCSASCPGTMRSTDPASSIIRA